MSIPVWAMSYYAAKCAEKYSLTEIENARLFRNFKIRFMKHIMQICVATPEEHDSNESEVKEFHRDTPLSEILNPRKRNEVVIHEPSTSEAEKPSLIQIKNADGDELRDICSTLLNRMDQLEKEKVRDSQNTEDRLRKVENGFKKGLNIKFLNVE